MNKFPIWRVSMLATGLAALGATLANGAELQLMAPGDHTLVKGAVTFQVRPQHTPEERFFENPDIILQNESGEEVQKVPAPINPETGVCSARIDTRGLPDGRYTAEFKYRCLLRSDLPETTSEFLTLGVPNSTTKPSRFTVKVDDKVYDEDHPATVTVRVLDRKGKPMPAARVEFKTNRGAPDDDAEITDSDGEVSTFVEYDKEGQVTLTVTVEQLAPVQRTLNFKAG